MENDDKKPEITNDGVCEAFHAQPLGTLHVKVKKLSNYINGPNEPAKEGDAGSDCFATRSVRLDGGERFNMALGVALEFPSSHVCLVQGKSGLANEKGIDTIGNVIDSGYRGEIHAQIVNTSNDDTVVIHKGDKICQLLFIPIAKPWFNHVEELSDSDRGDKGFGSTGK